MAALLKVTNNVAAKVTRAPSGLFADISGHEQTKKWAPGYTFLNLIHFQSRVSFFSPGLRPGSADLTWGPVLAALSQFTVIFLKKSRP